MTTPAHDAFAKATRNTLRSRIADNLARLGTVHLVPPTLTAEVMRRVRLEARSGVPGVAPDDPAVPRTGPVIP